MITRVVLHADMDAFYASVEQRDHPEYRGKPVIVGATSSRGVVSAASYEARKFGVRSAMPGFRARELCPHGIFLTGDMRKYAAVSRTIHEIFAEFTDRIEPLALDEAFLDITGSLSLLGSPLDIGRRLKERVRERTDLAVSVGIGPNKLVAKIACSGGKPDGLVIVEPGGVRALLDPLPVRALYGVGPKAAARLEALSLRTIGELADAPEAVVARALGQHAAEIQTRARGVDDRPVEVDRAPKTIGEESTFPDDVRDRTRILDALTVHAEAIASRARRAGYVGRTVTLKVKLSRRKKRGPLPGPNERLSAHDLFPQLTRQLELPESTADGDEIRRVAIYLWERLGLTEPVRLVGVSLSKLESSRGSEQLDLFAPRAQPRPKEAATRRSAAAASTSGTSPPDSAPSHHAAAPLESATTVKRGEQLGRTLDAIADKFGTGAVRRAVSDPGKIMVTDKKKIGERDP